MAPIPILTKSGGGGEPHGETDHSADDRLEPLLLPVHVSDLQKGVPAQVVSGGLRMAHSSDKEELNFWGGGGKTAKGTGEKGQRRQRGREIQRESHKSEESRGGGGGGESPGESGPGPSDHPWMSSL